jgi:hypothetical protein
MISKGISLDATGCFGLLATDTSYRGRTKMLGVDVGSAGRRVC